MASANRTSVASVKYESVDDTMAVKFIMNGTEDPNSKIKTHVDIYMAIERIYQDTIEAHGHKGYNPDWWRWKIEKSVWEKNWSTLAREFPGKEPLKRLPKSPVAPKVAVQAPSTSSPTFMIPKESSRGTSNDIKKESAQRSDSMPASRQDEPADTVNTRGQLIRSKVPPSPSGEQTLTQKHPSSFSRSTDSDNNMRQVTLKRNCGDESAADRLEDNNGRSFKKPKLDLEFQIELKKKKIAERQKYIAKLIGEQNKDEDELASLVARQTEAAAQEASKAEGGGK